MIGALIVTGFGAGVWMLSRATAWLAPPTLIARHDSVVLTGAAVGVAVAAAGVVWIVAGLVGAGW